MVGLDDIHLAGQEGGVMKALPSFRGAVFRLATAFWLLVFFVMPTLTLEAQSGHPLLGGARGLVRTASGAHLQGPLQAPHADVGKTGE